MKLSYDHLQNILEDMGAIEWQELGRLHVRAPMGLRIHGRSVARLTDLDLAEPIGRQNLEYGITSLGSHIWVHHRPQEYRR